jgi:intracellular septation protein A
MSKRETYEIFVLVMLAALWCEASVALAQTLTTDEPVPQKMWEIFIKPAFMLLMAVVGPFVTRYMVTADPIIKYLVAGLASMLVGAIAGQVPGFPLTSESAANMGAGLGPAGQAIVNGLFRKEVPVKAG